MTHLDPCGFSIGLPFFILIFLVYGGLKWGSRNYRKRAIRNNQVELPGEFKNPKRKRK